MFEKLLSEGIVFVESQSALWDEPLHPREAASLGEVEPERRREFAAGRACARAALELLGVESFPVVAGADRVPIWPPGFTGSITHCAGFAVAAVVRTEDIAAVGVDIETTTPLEQRTIEIVCTPSERAVIEQAPAELMSTGTWAKVVYSAKETAYKCAYTLDRVVLNYHDLEVSLDPHRGAFDVVITPNAETGAAVRHVKGKFLVEGKYVAAAAVIPADARAGRRARSNRGTAGRDDGSGAIRSGR